MTKKFIPIITHMTDSDAYKFFMGQVIMHSFSNVHVQYEFKLRNYPIGTLDKLKEEIEAQIDHLCTLRFTDEELDFLTKMGWFKPDYIEYLRIFQYNRKYIKVYIGTEDDGYRWVDAGTRKEAVYKKGEFRITIEGPLPSTILFEVPVLAIVSEVFTRAKVGSYMNTEAILRLNNKTFWLKEHGPTVMNGNGVYIVDKKFTFADFSTRRRCSKEFQEIMIQQFKGMSPYFVGTSNVYFAMKYNIKAIGTMAHEYLQLTQALVRLRDSQKFALQTWADEYRGDLGIALSDCLGMDAFLRDFDKYFSKLFDGCRHDSGDPYVWCDKLIAHYENFGIDPMTKTAVFSDGLDFERAVDIYRHYRGKINMSFGIGTYLGNDMDPYHIAPQIVIKMTQCNGQSVAKISDSKGKMMCKDEDYLNHLADVFGIEKIWRE